MATRLIIIRHGETEWNRRKKMQGHSDSSLSDLGKKQAEAVADVISSHGPFDVLYTSDMGRALETAGLINRDRQLEVIQETGLRERNLGVFQGLTWAECKEKYPDEYQRMQTRDPDYVIPEGESSRQRMERNVNCLNSIAAQQEGKTVLVVAHGGVLDSIFRHTLQIPLDRERAFSLFNAGINIFSVIDGKWVLEVWGDIAHLAGMGVMDDY